MNIGTLGMFGQMNFREVSKDMLDVRSIQDARKYLSKAILRVESALDSVTPDDQEYGIINEVWDDLDYADRQLDAVLFHSEN